MKHVFKGNYLKICHVCSGHTSDDSRVFHKECRSLAQEGYEVHLIATDKHLGPYESEKVIIHPLPPCGNRIKRIWRRWMVANLAAEICADLYHVHEPELLGPVLARVGNTPVIYDVHESYLDVLGQRDWIPRMARPLAKWLWKRAELRLIKKCRAVVAVAEPIAAPYSKSHGRVEVIRNFPDRLSGLWDGVELNGDRRACVFAGVLKKDRNLKNTILALSLLRRRGIIVPLWLAGRWESDQYKDEILSLADSQGIKEQVHYFGILTYSDTLALEARAAIGLVNLLPIQNSLKTLPIKLFECMALGLPVIYSNFPILQSYVGQYGAGLQVDPESVEQTAEAIQCLLANPEMARRMGEAGKRAAAERFNWSIERDRLVGLYQDILNSPSPSLTGVTGKGSAGIF